VGGAFHIGAGSRQNGAVWVNRLPHDRHGRAARDDGQRASQARARNRLVSLPSVDLEVWTRPWRYCDAVNRCVYAVVARSAYAVRGRRHVGTLQCLSLVVSSTTTSRTVICVSGGRGAATARGLRVSPCDPSPCMLRERRVRRPRPPARAPRTLSRGSRAPRGPAGRGEGEGVRGRV
jgi:hypothetical protein